MPSSRKYTLKELLTTHKRQKLTILAVCSVLTILAFSDIFSYFQGSDAVSNRMSAQKGSVTVIEPDWDLKGERMAAGSEPGMKIPKDPAGRNDGQVDLYIRLKMTISFDAYEGELEEITAAQKANGELGIPTDEERLRAILKALTLAADEDAAGEPLLTWDDSLIGWVNHNPHFSCICGASGTRTYDFYFYFVDYGTENMKTVPAGTSTEELFQRVDIPKYKRDYLGVFDQPYSISIMAEGIPVVQYPEGLTAAAAAAEFPTP